MGRNNVPKFGEWRDGKRFYFKVVGGHESDPKYPRPEDGRMIVFEVETAGEEKPRVLGVCYADGFQDCMAVMWESGHSKGVQEGREQAKAEMRAALGLAP